MLTVTDDVIQEIDVNKNIVFEWHSLDHIPITDSFFNLTSRNIDYAHFNSVNIDPFDNNLLISFRTTSEIVKVSRATGDIMWRLGGKKNEFTFIGEHAENAPYYFVGQHCIWRLTNGDLLFFDNGNITGGGVTPCDRTYSRAVQYKIDEVNKTAELVWEFRHHPDISAPSMGRVQKLSNGNVTIEWGSAIQNTASVPIVTEVSPAGELVYEMYFAAYNKGSHMQKYLWTSSDLVKSQTFQNVKSNNIYNSTNTGVSVTVLSMKGKENNGLAVKKHADAVRFPQFSGAVPQVLMDRVTISAFAIDEVTFDLNIDIKGMDFKDPNNMTVYQRPYEGQGVFKPLATYYDTNENKLVVLDAGPGEFIFTYPEVQQIASAPILKSPEDSSTISYAEPLTFEWASKGLSRSFHLQVAKDAEFTNIVIDEPNLKGFKYTMETIEPDTTYFWRLNMTNNGGTGDWSSASFTAVAPKIELIGPNGGDQLHKGLTYYIAWNYNMKDDVEIDLYRDDSLAGMIAIVSGAQVYEWEVQLSLRPGNNYYILVKRASDDTVYDMSDEPFSILN